MPYRNDFTEPEIEHWIRFREEHDEQIKALKQLINLGNEYGLDLSRPAQTAQEAVQWTYMATSLPSRARMRRNVVRPRLHLLRCVLRA